MKKEFEANLKLWNELVDIHAKSKFYDLEAFKAGKTSLLPTEIEELGDVNGKTMLHLQCHFGMDSLSWARKGAIVTGIDFSDKAIIKARELSKEIGVPATFIQSNVYNVPEVITDKFDIVFTSYGTLYWLDDLIGWAKVINHCLKPGGMFYYIDGHPSSHMIDEKTTDMFKISNPYFNNGKSFEWEVDGDYTDEDPNNPTILENKIEYGWGHTISEIINPLIKTGLKIESINEFPFGFHGFHPDLKKDEDGLWRFQTLKPEIPLTLSIKAIKPKT
ncbi:MAG: class I SAM-dependent methyltransferase [Candidatus Lokiarchaeota archaeon]|nr:class I SAM-dependent methyltransferase [Candidatus Lokiarchaeota archaeon]